MQRLRIIKYLPYLIVLALSLACRGSIEPLAIPTISNHTIGIDTTPAPVNNSTNTVLLPVVRQANDPTIASPTPDEPRELPEIRLEDDQYIVRGGDTLGNIASRNKITIQMLIDSNQITDPDLLEVGQILEIPAPILSETGSDFKIVPDSELVYGQLAQSFDIEEFVDRYDSYLSGYSEDVEGQTFTGPEVVLLVAHDYSVNPRLLVAILEYQSGWITLANPDEEARITPIGIKDGWHNGLYLQLAWAADMLNRGYYLWENDGIGGWLLSNGVTIPVNPTINAGTAGVQQFFALLYDRAGWDHAVSMDGLYATYSAFFGHPFDYAVEPLLPQNLEQPEMQLPFEPDVDWVYTGGPHGGWGSGSAWAALDFAPGNDGLGCVQSDLWVVSVADGPIIRADQGRVIQDLDGDGNEGTGWEVLYMHIEARGRVEPGTYLKAGEHIGHPSCEGGYSTGTHVHLARRYNGEWIPADQTPAEDGLPFNLDGWISSGNGIEYDGNLERDGEFKQAWEGYFLKIQSTDKHSHSLNFTR
jgi:murein DD-endopeptidase MepM/ murein hydrolase activator NlpD